MRTESRRKYYWLICQDPETSKVFLIAGGNTEDEARSKGLEMLGGIDFEIRALPTRSLPAASQMVKGKRLEDTHSLQMASHRIGHNKSLRRLRQRRERDIE